jgi:hypothetical protein
VRQSEPAFPARPEKAREDRRAELDFNEKRRRCRSRRKVWIGSWLDVAQFDCSIEIIRTTRSFRRTQIRWRTAQSCFRTTQGRWSTRGSGHVTSLRQFTSPRHVTAGARCAIRQAEKLVTKQFLEWGLPSGWRSHWCS